MEEKMTLLRTLILCVCIFPVLLFGIDISGTVSGVWSPENNPHNLIGDATIPVGQVLQIQPGVIVRAMGNYRITAAGSILAIGTESDSIRFVNGQTNPSAPWKGIRLENTQVQSAFSHCYVENGEHGINSINSPVEVQHSRFFRNLKGLHVYGIGAANPATVIITHCIIEFSGENGILIAQNSNTTISHCEIRENGVTSTYRGAIQLSNQSAGGSNSPTIAFNHIHHNRWQGITAWDIAAAGAINPHIHQNLIEYNLTGIYLLNSSGFVEENVIRNNYIPGDMNSGAGVMVSGATSLPYFERNTIVNNFTGFYITNNALPCLGNLDNPHPWAQGENVIRNNVDAMGVPHSVVCASYPMGSNVIRAENNYWDFDNAAGIASYITDRNDDPALPLVDFEPFLVEQQSITLIGDFVYNGGSELTQRRFELVSVTSGNVLAHFPLPPNGLINLNTPIAEPFYALVVASVIGEERLLYGCAGSFAQPQVFDPEGATNINVGTIQIMDMAPPRYLEVGASLIENGYTLYPLRNRFFVYAPLMTDWLFRDGNFVYLYRHSRRVGNQELSWDMPVGSIYTKVANLEHDEIWQQTRVIDDTGTISTNMVINKMLIFPPMGYPLMSDYSFQYCYDAELNLMNVKSFTRFYPTDPNLVFDYLGDHVAGKTAMHAELVQTDYSLLPLFTGNRWILEPQEIIDTPNMLSVHLENYYQNPEFHWQAPSSGNWNGYRIYYNQSILAELPFSQRSFTHMVPDLMNGYHYYYIVAFNADGESEPSNYAVFGPDDVEDEFGLIPVVKSGPNPFSLSSGSEFKVNLGHIPSSGLELRIHNLRGQMVYAKKVLDANSTSISWRGEDLSGKKCSSGLYLIRVISGNKTLSNKKILLVK